MNSPFLYLGAVMFGVPFVIMSLIALTGSDIQKPVLQIGGWTMAFGVITMGVGALFELRNR